MKQTRMSRRLKEKLLQEFPGIDPDFWETVHKEMLPSMYLSMHQHCLVANNCPCAEQTEKSRTGGAKKPAQRRSDKKEAPTREEKKRARAVKSRENPRYSTAEEDEEMTNKQRKRNEQVKEKSIEEETILGSEISRETQASLLQHLPDGEAKSAAQKELSKQFRDLEKTRASIKAELKAELAARRNEKIPDDDPELVRLEHALQKFAAANLAVFKSIFPSVYKTIQLVGSNEMDAKRDEIEEGAVQDYAKKHGTGFLPTVWSGVKWIASGIWKVLKSAFQAALWVFSHVKTFALYLATNPTTAKFSLIVAKFLRNNACRKVGMLVMDFEATVTNKPRVEMPNEIPFREVVRVAGPEALKTAALSGLKAAVPSAMNLAKSSIKLTLGNIPGVGGILTVASDVLFDSLQQATIETVSFYTYYDDLNTSFNLLVDLLNPADCYAEILKVREEVRVILEQPSPKDEIKQTTEKTAGRRPAGSSRRRSPNKSSLSIAKRPKQTRTITRRTKRDKGDNGK